MKNKMFNKQAFTLIEMMIAVSLFTIVMLVSTTMFLKSIDSQVRSINTKDLQEGLNHALTIIANEASQAVINPTSCNSEECTDERQFFCVLESGASVVFKKANNDCVYYSPAGHPSGAYILQSKIGSAETDVLTPISLNLSYVRFHALEQYDADYPTAKLTIVLKGENLVGGDYPDLIFMQTTVTIPSQK